MSNVKILLSGYSVDVEFTTFSDGAENCQLSSLSAMPKHKDISVQIAIEDCSRDIFRLALVKEALDAEGIKDVSLVMLYTPQARADRRFTKGSAHPLKVFSGMLNSMKFSEVLIADPHSDVTTALIDNVKVVDQTYCFKSMLPEINKVTKDFILCAPDLGATKKIFDTVMAIGHEDYLQAIKIRDVRTGNIIKCDIQCDNLQGKDVVIVDDLSDQGGSFIFLAKKLKEKNAGKVILYVTHGIFGAGFDKLGENIDYIFCYNLMERYTNRTELSKFNER